MTVPTARRITLASGGRIVQLPSPFEVNLREAQLRQSFYLVRIGGNDGTGEVWRCKGPDPKNPTGCGGKHPYLTLNCIEQPFSRATDGLYAYWYTVKEWGVDQMMRPGSPEWVRFQQLSQQFGFAGTPDIASSHPQLARSLTSDLTRRDGIRGSIGLGLLVEITPGEARMRRDAINARGCTPRFTLEGLER